MLSMPGVRKTNNSVSSLEEQTEIIRAMSEKGSKSSSQSSSVKNKDSSDKKKAKKRTTGASAALGTEPWIDANIVANPGGDAGGQEAEPGLVNQEGPEGPDDVMDMRSQNNMAGLPPQQTFQHQAAFAQPLLYYYPQQLPFQGFYQPGLPYPGMADPRQQDCWEEAASDSVEMVCSHRGTHDMSDKEEESVSVREVEKKSEKSLDFLSLKEGKMANLLRSRHQKAKEDNKVTPAINEVLAGIVNSFFEEAKVAGELERLAKAYPQVENIDKQIVPKLDRSSFQQLTSM